MGESPRRALQGTVIGDSDAAPTLRATAEDVGRLLARMGITVVTGGHGGVMEAASRGAATAGGLVVGILPSAEMDQANPWCGVVIPTGLGHARNAVTALAGDFVVALGGAAGTLSEICLAWIHGRPIFVLEGSGGWADRLRGQVLDHRRSSSIVACENLAALEQHLARLYPEIARDES